MGTAISEVLPFAVGVAISPIPIIAVILVLFSARARVNGPVFLAGWVLGVAIVSVVIYLIAAAGDVDTESGPSDTANWLKIILGLFLVRLAHRDWRKQHATTEPAPPKWMASIDSLTPLKAGSLGLLLSGVNPKNLTLSLAAGVALAEIGASGSEAAVGLAVFIVIASVSIAMPVVLALAGGDRARTVLDGWKAWLTTHNNAVMAVLLLVFGVVVFSQGLRGLTV